MSTSSLIAFVEKKKNWKRQWDPESTLWKGYELQKKSMVAPSRYHLQPELNYPAKFWRYKFEEGLNYPPGTRLLPYNSFQLSIKLNLFFGRGLLGLRETLGGVSGHQKQVLKSSWNNLTLPRRIMLFVFRSSQVLASLRPVALLALPLA